MSAWTWLQTNETRRAEQAAAAAAERVARALAPQAAANSQGVFSLPSPPRRGYRVTLHLWAEQGSVLLVAASDLLIERDWIPRELALLLLEAPSGSVDGTFVLHPVGSQRQLLLRRRVEAAGWATDALRRLASELVLQLEQMLTQLYARELILRRD